MNDAKVWTRGTHRVAAPGETYARFAPLAPRLGITRVADVTGLDVLGVPVAMAVRPGAVGLSVAQGKGLDRDAARASALMEALEAWHGENLARPLRTATALEMEREGHAVDVARLPTRSGAPFASDAALTWVRGWDLVGHAPAWVPLDCVSTRFTEAPGQEPELVKSTNGLASGNTLAEAAAHALAELVERDATARFGGPLSDEGAQRRLDLETVDDPDCRALIARFREAGVGVGAWDVTSDLGVPAAHAVVFERAPRPAWRPLGVFAGSGCHLEPGIALVRALTEAAQSRLTMIAGSRDDLLPAEYARCAREDVRAAFADAAQAGLGRAFCAMPRLATTTVGGDLAALVRAARRGGVRAIVVVDLTHRDVGVPVVKVVAPGMALRKHTAARGHT